jgi:hypothetical protein
MMREIRADARGDLVLKPKYVAKIWKKLDACAGCLVWKSCRKRINVLHKSYDLQFLFYNWYVGNLQDNTVVTQTCSMQKNGYCLEPTHLVIHAGKRKPKRNRAKNKWH